MKLNNFELKHVVGLNPMVLSPLQEGINQLSNKKEEHKIKEYIIPLCLVFST